MADNTLNSSAQGSWLERRFALYSRGSTLRTECLAGITGFLAAAYLLVVIPGLLAVGGMDKGAATTGTILVFVGGTLLMALKKRSSSCRMQSASPLMALSAPKPPKRLSALMPSGC